MAKPVSKKYYLINAIYQWCVDSDLSPCILVKVDQNAVVPPHCVEDDGCVLLDISPDCVRDFVFTKLHISFFAMFDDNEQQVFVPIGNILEIYAEENEEGLEFAFEEAPKDQTPPPRKSYLKLVK